MTDTPYFKLLLILGLGYLVFRVVSRALETLHKKSVLPEAVFIPLRGFTRWLIILAIVVLILQQFGVSTSMLVTAFTSIAVLIAVGFVAVWSVLSNILCALILLVFPPFRIGDRVEVLETLGGTSLKGKVTNLSLFFTTIEDSETDGATIRIPNFLFFQKSMRVWRGTGETRSLKSALLNDDTTLKNEP